MGIMGERDIPRNPILRNRAESGGIGVGETETAPEPEGCGAVGIGGQGAEGSAGP